MSTAGFRARNTRDLRIADTTTGKDATESAPKVIVFEKIGGHTSTAGVEGATAVNVKLIDNRESHIILENKMYLGRNNWKLLPV